MAKKRQDKKLEIKQSTKSTRVYLGFIRQKQAQRVFRPVAGLVECVFYFILAYACFWPQTEKVYLFLASALFFVMWAMMLCGDLFQPKTKRYAGGQHGNTVSWRIYILVGGG